MPKTTKKGGSLIDDVNKLVVPFGLLLAEKGISKMMKKDKKDKKTAAVSNINENKKAAVGGKKAKKPSKGGATTGSQNLVSEFNQLSNEIEAFLSKY